MAVIKLKVALKIATVLEEVNKTDFTHKQKRRNMSNQIESRTAMLKTE